MLEYRENCGHKTNKGWCESCLKLWTEAYQKGIKDGAEAKTGFMCKTDYYQKLGSASNASQIFSSIETLKQHKKCWSDCGVVEVEIFIKKIVK